MYIKHIIHPAQNRGLIGHFNFSVYTVWLSFKEQTSLLYIYILTIEIQSFKLTYIQRHQNKFYKIITLYIYMTSSGFPGI